jgi:hypothetical protein
MVQPDEVRNLLRKHPFEPFRIHLQDGRVYDIKYPRLNLVTDFTFVIGVPHPTHPDPLIGEGFIYVDWSLITRLESVGSSTSA